MTIQKKYVAAILMLCMLTMNIGTIRAEEETANTDTYTAAYEFVSDDGAPLPEEILRFVPENRTGLRDGDVVKNETQPAIVTNDYIYLFKSWDQDIWTIDGADVTFTGTWKRKERLKEPGFFMTKEEKNLTEDGTEKRSFARTYQTLRWDDFGASCWGTYEDGTRFYPSLYFVANERNADGTLKDRKICFCVQHDYAFYKGRETSYDTYDINDYPLLSKESKTKIIRIASFALKQDDMTWRNGRWQNIEEALAAQIAIWMVVADNNNTPRHKRLTIQECSTLNIDYINSRASYYYNSIANQEISEGITLEKTDYSGTVGQVFQVGTITDPSGATITLSDGVVFCDAEGNETDSPQWKDGYFYIKANKPVDHAVQQITALPSGQSEALFLDHPSTQNVVMAGAIVSSASFQVSASQMKLSVVKIPAETAFDYLQECPNNYSLEGAVYGVYTDQECSDLLGTLLTDQEGRSGSMDFQDEGTYYVKEIQSSPGYALDSTIYIAQILKGQDTVITSTEPPLHDPIRFRLVKQNAADKTRVKYLDTAEFTLRYYDTQEDDVSESEPKYEWIFKTEYSEDGTVEIIFDERHFVKGSPLLLNDYGDFFLPLGTFTIHESKAPQTYLIDENVYVGHIVEDHNKAAVRFVGEGSWEYLKIENECLIQTEREAIRTVASFRENGGHHYPADGFAAIMDSVTYDYLVPGQSYTLVSKLLDKQSKDIVLMNHTEFVPSQENGTVLVRIGEMDLTDLAGKSYVCCEYLYVTDEISRFTSDINELDDEVLKEYQLTCHEDLEDEDQTVYVDDLYSAAFVLYKIGDNKKDNKLSGAYFDVATRRTRRDGTVIEKDLGTFVTGGIYVEDNDPFTLQVYADEAMTELVGTYESKLHSKFKKQAVAVTDLKDGIYYAKKESEENCSRYRVGKGMVYLPDQEEDTQITFTELIAPIGYAIETKPFTLTVGHDDKIKEVSNYRSNYLLYVPVTGRDF